MRDSFSGAVCAYDIKRKIELTYYDLENTGDLSFVVSDMVKYCENRIRAYLGIRSRLGIKNLTAQHKQIINEYFDEHLPVYSRERNNKISNDYDDDNKIERKPFSVSIEKAREIERESWTVTDKLVDEEFFDSVDDSEKNAETAENVSIESESLDIAKKALICVYKSDSRGFNKIAQDNYMLPQTLAECVNELCYEAIGDIGIEEKDGEYIIIPDYEQEIRKWLSK